MSVQKNKCVMYVCLCHCASMCWEGDSLIEKGDILQKLILYSPVDFNLRNGWVQEWIRRFMWPIYSNRLQDFHFHLFHCQKIEESCIHKDSLWSHFSLMCLILKVICNDIIFTFPICLKKRFQHQYMLQRKVRKVSSGFKPL